MKRGEHIKNWRARYFILFKDGALLGYKTKVDSFESPLNVFTVKADIQVGFQIILSLSNNDALVDESRKAKAQYIFDARTSMDHNYRKNILCGKSRTT
jgi:hypothetical protein